ncbi:3-hydroxyacyl-CoA dehydrogenase NAD-binding domain-containing protein [Candidatus Neoehrlichia procyonis]|uniref:3-hydroxyacyl-CoA dehydrogenase, NAD binding domain protein n=1 Tax=Candidatus Neoehrlichia procyonis str. RAC413 TaxID=1359163 RepID=A0A0F3NLI1_9RICK|nr:3-hydroxyacyl-CoA dehydrogenase NAD-binding domain-containing protein [Candidatus Neoehrlichia lotoris]KJV68928.1 3-hydroxyacyl-CoA dehydrogenase, NAD binding domain protein [Candidatus Neoehrlichia lotoris str. RAC413]
MQIRRVAILGIDLPSQHVAKFMANIGISVALYYTDDKDVLYQDVVDNIGYPIQINTLENNIDSLKFADLIIDSMTNSVKDKCLLYNKIVEYINIDTIIALNSTVISLSTLCDKLSSKISKRLIVAHFSYMFKNSNLIEYVVHSGNSGNVLAVFREFCEGKLNKKVILCNDIAGLLIDRMGYFWIIISLINSYNFKIDVDIVDRIINEHICNSKLGIFRLLDSIGLDIFILKLKELVSIISKDDLLFVAYTQIPEIIFQMISDKVTGYNGLNGGFYRKYDTYNGNVNQTLDLSTGLYKAENVDYNVDILRNSKYKNFICSILSSISTYAVYIAEVTRSDILVIDDIVKLGFAWKNGLLELSNRFDI